eukprot:Gregarina_sp_Poly_1__4135@NODE_2263_length_2385_cov_175_128991_g1451_i0_p3_GENE_NODE_2263_length_2385_cov_175_128991_g1451_i0NODE_2263_length_2385_cov_175_128991_g1451_i0_p3_ORF_typecomplete_len102_score7_28_NODE_2263_length_2385_cov_175_128991_g1451_i0387692
MIKSLLLMEHPDDSSEGILPSGLGTLNFNLCSLQNVEIAYMLLLYGFSLGNVSFQSYKYKVHEGQSDLERLYLLTSICSHAFITLLKWVIRQYVQGKDWDH